MSLVAEAVASSLRVERRDRGAVRTATRRAHRQSAEDVKTILGERFRENLSLADLARAVHSSPYHLSRVFTREAGIPIHRYRTRLRLRASLDRVMDPLTSLTDLALDLGFSSHSHFTDAFRREFGVSPSRLREAGTLKELARHSRRHVA